MKNIFVGIFFIFITDHTQALDVVSLKIGIPYFEYGYIPTQFLDKPMYACIQPELKYGESLWYWIDFEQRSPLYQDYDKWVLLWTKELLKEDIVDSCFTIPEPQQRFTMYMNATSNSTADLNKHRAFDVSHGLYTGTIDEFTASPNDKKIWPDPNRVPGYLQSDYQCTDVYTVAANDIVTVNYGIATIPGYIHKLTIQEDSMEFPLSNWEQDRPEYIVNEELLAEGESFLEFTAPKNMDMRIFFYTFAREDLFTPLRRTYGFNVTTHRIIDAGKSETPVTLIKPSERTYPASILCPRY
ncbi:hypothetical protein HCN44_006147 [Aphidius gifuensis]|uniref:Uncharacterized protein n=1 Tax=Aphidius gifuensis TaxID=684658 RepID=A0A834Y6S9_APHGI|nr:uncharacterized protein LOC122852654 [Aphidius gifuensis]KAF7997576.1 hypothetical protein HCN44_006147 [Aphidius gifuensis]